MSLLNDGFSWVQKINESMCEMDTQKSRFVGGWLAWLSGEYREVMRFRDENEHPDSGIGIGWQQKNRNFFARIINPLCVPCLDNHAPVEKRPMPTQIHL